jgi:L-seryl-tRNA(Ser) seleniumtransferase
MLAAGAGEIYQRARRIESRLSEAGVTCEVVGTSGAVGGGTFPGIELPSHAVAISGADASGLARKLRAGEPPVIGRIVEDRLLLDVRTVLPGQEDELIRGVVQAAAGPG